MKRSERKEGGRRKARGRGKEESRRENRREGLMKQKTTNRIVGGVVKSGCQTRPG